MSFSGEIKEELCRHRNRDRHCMIAELHAIITMCGGVSISAVDRCSLRIHTENPFVARKSEELLQSAFDILPEVGIRVYARSRVCTVAVACHEDVMRILKDCSLISGGDAPWMSVDIGEELGLAGSRLLHRKCCRRAYLRGAFLCAGSMSDPARAYHFEIVCQTWEKAELLQEIAGRFGLDAKIARRKQYAVFYLKEGTQIVEMLGIMEAARSLMKLENIRILREISNGVNRRVNCETANIGKTVSAALRQVQKIEKIRENGGLDQLPPELAVTARMRLEFPEVSLEELGKRMDPPIGKSGMKHRMDRLSRFADTLTESAGP